jgi:tripartite-type tricarboxylate transporter receptor subunit TctC
MTQTKTTTAPKDLTVPQVEKAQRLEQAFRQVLDDPAAQEALQHSDLKPLLEQAAY